MPRLLRGPGNASRGRGSPVAALGYVTAVNSSQKGRNTRTPPLIKQITDGHHPLREDITRVQGITVMQDDDIALVMIDVNRARAQADDNGVEASYAKTSRMT